MVWGWFEWGKKAFGKTFKTFKCEYAGFKFPKEHIRPGYSGKKLGPFVEALNDTAAQFI